MEQDWLRERPRTLRERLDRRLEEADALRGGQNASRPHEGARPEEERPAAADARRARDDPRFGS